MENEVLSITEETDKILQDLQSAMANHEEKIAEKCHIYWQIYMGLSAWQIYMVQPIVLKKQTIYLLRINPALWINL